VIAIESSTQMVALKLFINYNMLLIQMSRPILHGGIRAVEVSQSVEAPGTKRMYGRDTQPPDLRWLLSFQQPG